MDERWFRFSMQFNYAEYLPFYRGDIDRIEVRSYQGQVLWIHPRHFRRFVTASGLKGNFELQLDQDGRLLSLTKLS